MGRTHRCKFDALLAIALASTATAAARSRNELSDDPDLYLEGSVRCGQSGYTTEQGRCKMGSNILSPGRNQVGNQSLARFHRGAWLGSSRGQLGEISLPFPVPQLYFIGSAHLLQGCSLPQHPEAQQHL